MTSSTTSNGRTAAKSTGNRSLSGPGVRLQRTAYFEAAFALLGAEGPEALTIASLCRRLKVTKGSFYHHFSGMPEFTDALLRHWEDDFATILDEIAGVSDPVRRFELIADVVFAMDHNAEAALRAWGYRDPAVGVAVARMDRARTHNYADSMALVITEPERCRLLGYMGNAMLIGLQMCERPVNRERIVRASLEWVRTNVGLAMDVEVDGTLTVARVTAPPNS